MLKQLTKALRGKIALLILLLPMMGAQADEGMWLLGRTDKKAMDVARSLGLQLTDAQLYGEDGTSLKDCVVDFGDYCSGVIVSSDGLLFTNHHCGFRAIQQLSTTDDDILGNGFVARTREDERPVDGLYIKIWQRSEDVTEQVNTLLEEKYADKTLAAKAGKDRKATIYSQTIGQILGKIASDAEKVAEGEGQKGIVCEAKAFEGGRLYLLNYYRQYSDVRLVFTVPQSKAYSLAHDSARNALDSDAPVIVRPLEVVTSAWNIQMGTVECRYTGTVLVSPGLMVKSSTYR